MENRIGIVRLKRELVRSIEQLKGKCTVDTIDDDLYSWSIKIYPFDTARYGDREFFVKAKITKEYPLSPPHLTFSTPIFHPNVDKNGKVCLALLANWTNRNTMNECIEELINQLAHPHLDDPVNLLASKLWNSVKEFSVQSMKG